MEAMPPPTAEAVGPAATATAHPGHTGDAVNLISRACSFSVHSKMEVAAPVPTPVAAQPARGPLEDCAFPKRKTAVPLQTDFSSKYLVAAEATDGNNSSTEPSSRADSNTEPSSRDSSSLEARNSGAVSPASEESGNTIVDHNRNSGKESLAALLNCAARHQPDAADPSSSRRSSTGGPSSTNHSSSSDSSRNNSSSNNSSSSSSNDSSSNNNSRSKSSGEGSVNSTAWDFNGTCGTCCSYEQSASCESSSNDEPVNSSCSSVELGSHTASSFSSISQRVSRSCSSSSRRAFSSSIVLSPVPSSPTSASSPCESSSSPRLFASSPPSFSASSSSSPSSGSVDSSSAASSAASSPAPAPLSLLAAVEGTAASASPSHPRQPSTAAAAAVAAASTSPRSGGSLTCTRTCREPVLGGANDSDASAAAALSPETAAAATDSEDRNLTYSLEDRHLIWRKNAALHYAGVLSHRLEWPSMTVEFLSPASVSSCSFRSTSSAAALYSSNGDAYVSHRMLLGTCTSGEEKNYLTIAEMRWPSPSFEEDPLRCETYSGFIPPRARARCGAYSLASTASGGACASVGSTPAAGVGSGSASSGVVGSGGSATASALTQAQAPGLEIRARILHPGDLLRATHMPQNFFNIITLNEEGLCLYWNFARHPSFPSAEQTAAKPQLLLMPGHVSVAAARVGSATPKAQAAAWSAADEGHLFTCTDTGMICKYDLSSALQSRHRVNSSSTGSSSTGSSSTGSSSGGSSCAAAETPGSSSLRRLVYGGKVTLAESTPELLPVTSYTIQESSSSEFSSSNCCSLNDVKVHPRYAAVVGAAGEDGCMRLLDTRMRRQAAAAAAGGKEGKSGAAGAAAAATAMRTDDIGAQYAAGDVWKERRSTIFPSSTLTAEAGKGDSAPSSAASAGAAASTRSNALNCLSFSRHYESLAAVGDASGCVLLFDLRLLQKPLLQLSHHTEEITCLHFSPCNGALLASGSADGDVAIWNLAQQQQHQTNACGQTDADEEGFPSCCRCSERGLSAAAETQQQQETVSRTSSPRNSSAVVTQQKHDSMQKGKGSTDTEEEDRKQLESCTHPLNAVAEAAATSAAAAAGSERSRNENGITAAKANIHAETLQVVMASTTAKVEVPGGAVVIPASDSKSAAAAAAGVVEWRPCCTCGKNRRGTVRQKELMFVHAGHAGGVSDFAWSAEAAAAGGSSNGRRSEAAAEGRAGQLLAASVGWDNRIQIWQPSEHYFLDFQNSTAVKKKRLFE